MDYTQPLPTQTIFSFSEIATAVQPWLQADVNSSELYAAIGLTLDTLLGTQAQRFEFLRNPLMLDDKLLTLMAQFLGFQWEGISTLDTSTLQKLCQTISSYYARNGAGSVVLFKQPLVERPLGLENGAGAEILLESGGELLVLGENILEYNAELENKNGDILLQDTGNLLFNVPAPFFNDTTFQNTQTTARIVSFLLGNAIVIEQLWTQDYTSFYTTKEVELQIGHQLTYEDTIYSRINVTANTIDVVGPNLWYLTPHVQISILESNSVITYGDLISLFYYLAPVTMVIESVYEKYISQSQLYYLSQANYKTTFYANNYGLDIALLEDGGGLLLESTGNLLFRVIN